MIKIEQIDPAREKIRQKQPNVQSITMLLLVYLVDNNVFLLLKRIKSFFKAPFIARKLAKAD
jgi:hypothetical protein